MRASHRHVFDNLHRCVGAAKIHFLERSRLHHLIHVDIAIRTWNVYRRIGAAVTAGDKNHSKRGTYCQFGEEAEDGC